MLIILEIILIHGVGFMKYTELAHQLAQEFKKNKNGEMIESERSLCKRYKVNRNTIHKALEILTERGIVIRAKNKRYFYFLQIPETLNDGVFTLARDMQKIGKQYEVQVISITEVKTAYLDTIFNRDVIVYQIDRLRSLEGVPCIFETNYLPVEIYPELPFYLRDNISLYQLIKEHYKVFPTHGTESFYVTKVDSTDIVQLLNISPNDNIIVAERKVYFKDLLYEYSQAYINTEGFRFTFNLTTKDF